MPALMRILCGLCVLLSTTGCADEATPTASISNDGTTATSAKTAAAKPKRQQPTEQLVEIVTSHGTIVVKMDAKNAPGTVQNFLSYAYAGYYENTLIHYTAADKMILGGGFDANGDAKSPRADIRNEAHNGLKNVKGTIAMMRDPSRIDSAASQFFINLTNSPELDYTGDTAADYGYCVFGKVVKGMDVATKIAQLPTADRELGGATIPSPTTAVVIKHVRLK